MALPQLSDATFITDGGMETTLIFHEGLELPHFASFVLLEDEEGLRMLREYFGPYIEIAREAGVGIALDTPTWRANPDWGERLGYSADALADVNRRGVRLLEQLRDEACGRPQVVICGCIGPRGDPVDLARRYAELRERLPNLNVVGGCCGTDHRHIREICRVFA